MGRKDAPYAADSDGRDEEFSFQLLASSSYGSGLK